MTRFYTKPVLATFDQPNANRPRAFALAFALGVVASGAQATDAQSHRTADQDRLRNEWGGDRT